MYSSIYLPILRNTPAVHTPHFVSLVQYLLQRTWDWGLLPDIPAEHIPLIADLSGYHDIGKMLLPSVLLNKTEALTDEEYAQFKKHAELGESFMRFAFQDQTETASYRYVCEICRHHHERWDGSGYPDGLKEREIPRYVHVISLADAYDALVSSRPNKPAVPHRRAANMIVGGECGSFRSSLLTVLAENVSAIQMEVYHQHPDPPEE